jgi:hypothetical protein
MPFHRLLSLVLLLSIDTLALAAPTTPSGTGEDFMVRPRAGEALYAQEEVDVEFFLGDTRKTDPVLGPSPVPRATIRAEVTMPAMPGMGAIVPAIHEEGQPGYYGIVLNFPHGGEYRATLSIRTRGGETATLPLALKVLDAQPGRRREKPYRLDLSTSPARPRSGEPVELRLRYESRKDRQVVRAFDVVHEQKMHLIVVSKDLRFFEHVHPTLAPDGAFTVAYTFPHGGDFRLFTDATPTGAGQQVLIAPIHVQGPPAPSDRQAPDPSRPMTGAFDGMEVAVTPQHQPVRAHEDNELIFSLRRQGQPVTDLMPWLGAMGHLVLIHEDGETFVHSHPADRLDAGGRPLPPDGQIAFWVRFPKPGVYRLWGQFNRGTNGEPRIVTTDFSLRVEAS